MYMAFGRLRKLQDNIMALDTEERYTVPEAAVYLKVKETTIDKYMYRTTPPLLPDYRTTVDGSTRVHFRKSTLDAYAQTRRKRGRPSKADSDNR